MTKKKKKTTKKKKKGESDSSGNESDANRQADPVNAEKGEEKDKEPETEKSKALADLERKLRERAISSMKKKS